MRSRSLAAALLLSAVLASPAPLLACGCGVFDVAAGSTDILLGGYKMGRFGAGSPWAWYGSAQWDQPVLISGGYRPGTEVNAVAGACFDGWRPPGSRRPRWRKSSPPGARATRGCSRPTAAPATAA